MILQKAYLVNVLVNPQGKSNSFYEMDLLLEHQNRAFKRFCADGGSFLQETDGMFRLHALTIDVLTKVRQIMNKIIVGQEQEGYHPKKDSFFDILSLADHLYRSRSTTPKSPQPGKVYFSFNPVLNLFAKDIKALFSNIDSYNRFLEKNEVLTSTVSSYEPRSTLDNPLDLDAGSNKTINKMFNAAGVAFTSERAEIEI